MGNQDILNMIKESYYVNCDMEFLCSPDSYKKYKELKKEIDEKGLSRERMDRLNEIKSQVVI